MNQNYRLRQKWNTLRLPGLLIFSSLDDSSYVRQKFAAPHCPGYLYYPHGSSCVRLKVCCTAVPRLLIFSSLDGNSYGRL